MKFSEGFNPHPVMTVAMPLSVGITSDCEYMKIGFSKEYEESEIMERINKEFPKGFSVVAVKKTQGKEHDFAKLDRAVYRVEIEAQGIEKFNLDSFLKNQELIVLKKTKSGEKESDIRPYIYSVEETSRTQENLALTMCIAAGNNYNLKVDSVIDAMNKYTDGFSADFFCVHREKILAGDKELI